MKTHNLRMLVAEWPTDSLQYGGCVQSWAAGLEGQLVEERYPQFAVLGQGLAGWESGQAAVRAGCLSVACGRSPEESTGCCIPLTDSMAPTCCPAQEAEAPLESLMLSDKTLWQFLSRKAVLILSGRTRDLSTLLYCCIPFTFPQEQ